MTLKMPAPAAYIGDRRAALVTTRQSFGRKIGSGLRTTGILGRIPGAGLMEGVRQHATSR
jgi:hypothetical protein